MFVIKLRLTQFIRKIVNSKPFLFLVTLAIGISCTTCYFVGNTLYTDLFFQEHGRSWINPKFVADAYAAKIPQEKPVAEWRSGEFSAYTPRVEETDGDPYTNAANKHVKEGDIACPKHYDFGTRIEVLGYGVFECQDRMNQRYVDKENFDIFMWDLTEAYNFGRQQLEYRIIEK